MTPECVSKAMQESIQKWFEVFVERESTQAECATWSLIQNMKFWEETDCKSD